MYNDGKHRVFVYYADHVNGSEGGYQIGFRSSGAYSLSGASLISGLHHHTLDEHLFATDMIAQITVQYEGKKYTGSMVGASGLNYKDGDDFLIYMPSLDTQGQDEAAIDEPGIVQVDITGLYMNRWTKI
ncbi:hypothetical protein [Paenibacillus gorillae]|uniref:hypothetical protein n=1 Tax=Paenibacillus gorillae TaxID=1243662 RepID=UPI0004BA317B|nr:hypothetical protein [Paenibacillus gorillae]